MLFFSSLVKRILNSYCGRNRTYTYQKSIERLKHRIMNGVKTKPKYAPGTVTLQVLGSGADGAPASVYLFTDQSRYLFNCGEGTQRLAHEHKTKLSRLQHIFFTGKSWSKLGGLPGLALTVQDAGVSELTLHGPPELNTLFQAMSRFVVIKKLRINTSTVNNTFEDEVMTVYSLPIESCKLGVGDQTTEETNATSIMYVCKLKPRPGTLDLKKCVEKGVPAGPLLGLLKSGKDIVLDNGNVVKSSDVSEPTIEDQTICFIDVPNENYFNSLVQQKHLYKKASLVVHFTPGKVTTTSLYREFLSGFDQSTAHLFLNSTNRFSGYYAAHRIQTQLNQLNKNIFPILGETKCTKISDENSKRTKKNLESENATIKNSNENMGLLIYNVDPMTCYRLRPNKGLDRSMELNLSPDEYLKETYAIEGFAEALQNLYSALSCVENKRSSRELVYPNIIFLGTGSCIPNKTRNVSAILLQQNEDSFMLLDCGEGTLGQIIRFYGSSRWQSVVKSIKAVYISHLHADHHIGLIGILKERAKLLGRDADPLYLFAPKQIQSWLDYYDTVVEPIRNGYNLIPNGDMVQVPYQSKVLRDFGINSISTCLVKHCAHSFGVSILLSVSDKNNELLKLTYSGDTMPSEDLIKLGADSSILIHEATMEDELIEEAKIKMHCTISQALDVAQKMGARNTILTHFSQRYAKLPRMPEGLLENTAIAFDFMQVTVDDLKSFSYMYPVMKLMFSDHYEDMEKKAQMRLIKSERKRKSNM